MSPLAVLLVWVAMSAGFAWFVGAVIALDDARTRGSRTGLTGVTHGTHEQSRAITAVGKRAGQRLVEQSRVGCWPRTLTGSRVNHGSGYNRRSRAVTAQSRVSRTVSITGAPPSLLGGPRVTGS